MDLPLEELQTLTLTDILKESFSIPRSSPRTFSLITLTLIFPLSFAVLAHTLFTHPILNRLQSPHLASPAGGAASPTPAHEWGLLLLYQFLYLLFLFCFSLLSTAAVVFTVASIYTSKAVSFSSTLSAILPVFSRLFRTFLWVSLLMLLYNLAFVAALVVLILGFGDDPGSLGFVFFLAVIFLVFLTVHVYITALWHLASVVTVLEPMCGVAAMRKSRELLKGRTRMASTFVLGYLGICGLIGGVFGAVVVRGGDEEGLGVRIGARIVVGGALVAVLVVVNLVGLLVQSVFYYVCKSYHHQGIDKSALYDHLGGYLGEYVPLKSSIQMESL